METLTFHCLANVGGSILPPPETLSITIEQSFIDTLKKGFQDAHKLTQGALTELHFSSDLIDIEKQSTPPLSLGFGSEDDDLLNGWELSRWSVSETTLSMVLENLNGLNVSLTAKI